VYLLAAPKADQEVCSHLFHSLVVFLPPRTRICFSDREPCPLCEQYDEEEEERRQQAVKQEKLRNAELLQERSTEGMSDEEQQKNSSFTNSLITKATINISSQGEASLLILRGADFGQFANHSQEYSYKI
jgi:hypothetical protein